MTAANRSPIQVLPIKMPRFMIFGKQVGSCTQTNDKSSFAFPKKFRRAAECLTVALCADSKSWVEFAKQSAATKEGLLSRQRN